MIVIKVGGAAGIAYENVCNDAAELIRRGEQIVLVHGGSDETNRLAEQLGHPPRFLTSPSGHTSRYTDERTIEIFQMACCGVINKRIVRLLAHRGVHAVGLSGMDGGVWRGRRKNAIRAIIDGATQVIRDDYTGTVDEVNTELLLRLLNDGYTPVLTPPAMSEECEAINVDADRAAARTASRLEADVLIILSNVPGLLREFPDESSLISEISLGELEGAMDVAQGRMKKKVLAAREAVDGHGGGRVGRVVLADARVDGPILRAMDGCGTVIS